MKKFDLKAALAGQPVQTRDGRKVTQIVHFEINEKYPVYAVVEGDSLPESFRLDGSYMGFAPNTKDLFMTSKTLTTYVNVYRDGGAKGVAVGDNYLTEDAAVKAAKDLNTFLGAYPITVEV